MKEKKRVLIVDDRKEYVRFFKKLLEDKGEFSVEFASKFLEILRKAVLGFDVILLNIEMGEVSGLDILYQVMRKTKTPVIVVTSDSDFSSEETLTALSYGAVDFWQIDDNFNLIESNRDKIIALINSASLIKPKNNIFKKVEKRSRVPKFSEKIVVLGSSTGGPGVVTSILSSFPKGFPAPVIVVQHMTKSFTKIFAKKLRLYCEIEVKEARDLEEVKGGVAYIAPGGFNLEIFRFAGKHFISLNKKKASLIPSIDLTLLSVSRYFGKSMIGVILTGIGKDGSLGVKKVKALGGKIIAQNKRTSVVFGMPKAVIDQGDADYVLPEGLIGKKIIQLL